VAKGQVVNLAIFDIEGRLVYSFPQNGLLEKGMNSITLNTVNFASGGYFLRVQDEITTQIKRWVKK
jgi:hypothetical protein